MDYSLLTAVHPIARGPRRMDAEAEQKHYESAQTWLWIDGFIRASAEILRSRWLIEAAVAGKMLCTVRSLKTPLIVPRNAS
jgi:hypothetical protein